MVVAENVALLILGLAGGTFCASLAVLPAMLARGGSFPLTMIGLLLTGVMFAGVASSILAVTAALRSPLLASLKSE
jgi:hypothetical protein